MCLAPTTAVPYVGVRCFNGNFSQVRVMWRSFARRRKEYKLALGRLMAVLRRVYKPYMVACRKFHRLKIAREKRIAAARLDIDQENWIQEPFVANPDKLSQPHCEPPKSPLSSKVLNNSSDFTPRHSPPLSSKVLNNSSDFTPRRSPRLAMQLV